MLIINREWRKLSGWERYKLLLNAHKNTIAKWEDK